ncbi:GNAT family N-acetyltransferase [Nonomuraea antimicrobica]
MLRDVRNEELPVIRRWRNHPRVRAASFTTHEISRDEHTRWWAATLADATRRVLIYDHDGAPAGVVHYTDVLPGTARWGFYLDLDGLERAGTLLRAWVGLERAAIEHAFGPLGLTTLCGRCWPATSRSCGCTGGSGSSRWTPTSGKWTGCRATSWPSS